MPEVLDVLALPPPDPDAGDDPEVRVRVRDGSFLIAPEYDCRVTPAREDAAARLLRAFLSSRSAETLRAYSADLADLARFVGVSSAARAIDAVLRAGAAGANALALAWRSDLIDRRKLAPATVNRRLASLRSLLKLARILGLADFAVEVDGARSESYRDTTGPGLDGWRALLATAEAEAAAGSSPAARDLAIVRLLHDLALRRGELVRLDLDHYDPQLGTVAIVGKGKREPIRLKLNDPSKAALDAWIRSRGPRPGPLFPRLDPGSGRAVVTRISGQAVAGVVARLARRAGITRPVRPHGLRHQAITRALDLCGGDVRRVRKFSRHAKVETLLRYDDARRDEAAAFAAMLGDDA